MNKENYLENICEIFCCPVCNNKIEVHRQSIICEHCKYVLPEIDGLYSIMPENLDGLELCDWVTRANEKFYSFYAEKFSRDRKKVIGKSGYSRISKAIAYIRERGGNNLWLEAGCGSGSILEQIQSCRIPALGVDISSKALNIANNKGLYVLRGDINNLPLNSEVVGAIFAVAVLHHLKNPHNFFVKAYDALATGGWLYTDNDPNQDFYNSFPKITKWKMKFQRNRIAHIKPAFLSKLGQIAEYHYYKSSGLNASDIRDDLLSIGFKSVQVVFHDDSSGILIEGKGHSLYSRFKLKLKQLILRKKNNRYLMPSFLILAQK